MNIKDHFEPIYKMKYPDQLWSTATPTTFPAKFRPINHNESFVEPQSNQANDCHLDLGEVEWPNMDEPDGRFFFKDPFRLMKSKKNEDTRQTQVPSEAIQDNKTVSTKKSLMDDHRKIFHIMKEGNQLIQQQKQEQVSYQQQAESSQAASVLLNELLRHGFNVTPPKSTPRLAGDSKNSWLSMKGVIKDDKSVNSIELDRMVVSMYKELLRLNVSKTEVLDNT